jgi:hypothetical protein
MACNAAFFGDRIRCMGKKPMTVTEMASMGGRTRAQKYSKAELREFAKGAGRPVKLDGRARRRLRQLLAIGKSHAECAAELGKPNFDSLAYLWRTFGVRFRHDRS